MTTRTIVAGSSGQGREEEEQEASAGGPEEEAQGGAGRRTCLMESSLFYWLPFEQSWPRQPRRLRFRGWLLALAPSVRAL